MEGAWSWFGELICMSTITQIFNVHNLLLKLFEPDELRMFLHLEMGEDGEQLLACLPGSSASAEVVAYRAVVALERRGLLGDALFDALLLVRPRRAEEILQVKHGRPADKRAA